MPAACHAKHVTQQPWQVCTSLSSFLCLLEEASGANDWSATVVTTVLVFSYFLSVNNCDHIIIRVWLGRVLSFFTCSLATATKMLDPLPPPPPWLVNLAKPYSEALDLPSLPYHIHEVVGAFILYQTTQSIISPLLSTYLFPEVYPKLTRRTRINWDVHAVSLLQSALINTAALWVMFKDQERKDMQANAVERVYGYTGASGLIQGFATGYFFWDLVVSARYLKIFGPGILAHAVTALAVFALGFVSNGPAIGLSCTW